MDKALKIAWIKRLTEHDDAAWKIIPEFAATDYGGLSFLIECQYDAKYLSLDNLPPFYHTLPRENDGTEREAPSPGLGICQFH